MARITVEDCIEKIPNRFELITLAAQRSRDIARGERPMIDRERDKNTVLALREISEGLINEEETREEIVKSLQKVHAIEEKGEEELSQLITENTRQLDESENKVDPFFNVAKKDNFLTSLEGQNDMPKFEDVDVEQIEE